MTKDISKIKCYYSSINCVDCVYSCDIWNKLNDLNDLVKTNLRIKRK